MKKITSVLLCVCLLLSALGLSALAAKTGDVDYNNKIEAADARLILRASVGLETFDSTKNLIGDVDFDGKITAADARLALRCSVGLEVGPAKAYANEYEAFIDGHFSADMYVGEDDEFAAMTLGITSDSVYTAMEMEGMKLVILMNKAGQYLIFNNEKAYAKLSDEFFAMMGMSKEELMEAYSMTGMYKPLTAAVDVTEGSVDDVPCTVYTIDYGSYYSDVYMNGKKLMAIVDYNDSYKEETFFENFSVYVPSDYTTVPAGYAETII